MSLTIEFLRNEIEEIKAASLRGSPTTSRDLNHYLVRNGNVIKPRDEVDRNLSDVESEGEDEFYDFTEGSTDDEPKQNGVILLKHSTSSSEDDKLIEVIKRIDKMFEDNSVDRALVFQVVSQACENLNQPERLMYRRVKANNYLVIKAKKDGNKEEMKKLAFKTVEYAKEALELFPDSAECNKWYAIAIGGINDFVSTKEKIENGSLFKQHVDKAISLSPNDATLYYMLSRFCSSIAALSWIERKIASTIFAEVPQATVQDAYTHSKKAYQLKREWKENIVQLCRSSFELGLSEEGRKYLEEGIRLPIKGEDDELSHQELLQLKTKYCR